MVFGGKTFTAVAIISEYNFTQTAFTTQTQKSHAHKINALLKVATDHLINHKLHTFLPIVGYHLYENEAQ